MNEVITIIGEAHNAVRRDRIGAGLADDKPIEINPFYTPSGGQPGGFFIVGSITGSAINCAVDETEKKLITEVLDGHPDSFEPLVVKHQPRVFAIARRYARREDEVEDIVQTVFIKAYSKLSSFRGDAPFEHWLMRMATFTCYDFLRKHQRNREWNATDLSNEENDWLENVGEESTAKTDRNAAKALVDKLLDGLKPADRHIIILLDLEGKSVKEIAELTNLSESNVKVKAHRARDKMKKLLTKIVPEKYL